MNDAILNRVSSQAADELRQQDLQPTLTSQKAGDRLIALILGEYVNGLPEHISSIHAHLANADLKQLRQRVHQLKGSGGSYGFPQISNLAATAEEAIHTSQSLEQIGQQVNALIEMVRRVQGYDPTREIRD